MAPFIHRPLTEPGEIRLLDLKQRPGMTSPITLEMRHIVIEDLPESTGASQVESLISELGSRLAYIALSYAWGDEKNDRLIVIDDAEFYVTANLECVLRRLQALRCSVWVDAICINQKDDAEKSAQVRMMKSIYSLAINVLVWLGEEKPETTALAMNFLKEHIRFDDANLCTRTCLDNTRNNAEYAAAWDAVGQDILKRPWWRRMWVIQEIALARRAMVVCGPHVLRWDFLVIASRFARNYDLPIFYKTAAEIASGDRFLDNSLAKATYSTKRKSGSPLQLHELLINNVSCFSSDPRDMIFSLLGLATDVSSAPEVDCNYEKSIRQVYIDFFKFQSQKYGSLDILTASKHPKKHLDLPSWVPDWSNLKENMATLLPSFTHDATDEGQYVYHASGNAPLVARFSSDDAVLGVSGIYVDSIATLGKYADLFVTLIDDLEAWSHLAFGANWERVGHAYVGGGNTFDAFNRTIVGDKTRSGHRAQRGQWGFHMYAMEESDVPESYRLEQDLSSSERLSFWREDVTQSIALRSQRRRLLITEKGYLGLCPRDAVPGDSVFVISGCSVPVILRRKGEKWHFVGESFVTGIMDGEIVVKAEQESSQNPQTLEQEGVLPKDSWKDILLC